MAVIKNRKYCTQCHKQKFLWESEAKANNFLKFNHDIIMLKNDNGKAPIRAYYCSDCCGWHVTSRGYEEVEFNPEPAVDTAEEERKRKKEQKFQEELEKENEIKSFYQKIESDLDEVEHLLQSLNFATAQMKLMYLKNSQMPQYAQVFIQNNKRYILNKRIDSYISVLQIYKEKFADCIEADSVMSSLGNDLDVAETLFDLDDYADAKAKVVHVNDILTLLKDKLIYDDERKSFQKRVDELLNRLSYCRFKDKAIERVLTLEQLIKNQDKLPTLTIEAADGDSALDIVQFQMEMAYETEGIVLDIDEVGDGVMEVLENEEKGRYILAKKRNLIVGSLMLTKEWSDWNNEWYIWIQSVYVRPEFRRQGIFTFMYTKVKEIAREMGSTTIRLYVDSDNRVARTVYENLGMDRSHYLLYEEKL